MAMRRHDKGSEVRKEPERWRGDCERRRKLRSSKAEPASTSTPSSSGGEACSGLLPGRTEGSGIRPPSPHLAGLCRGGTGVPGAGKCPCTSYIHRLPMTVCWSTSEPDPT